MGVEPFDLDAPSGEPGAGAWTTPDHAMVTAPEDQRDQPARGRARSPVAAVAVLAAAAVAGGLVGGLAVRSHLLAAAARARASQVRLVATASDLVAARATPAGTSEVVLSVQLVNAGPRRVDVRAVSADGGGRALRAASAAVPVASGAETRLVLSGPVTCRDHSSLTTTRVSARVRTADGRTRSQDLGTETAVRWTSALERACALPYATP